MTDSDPALVSIVIPVHRRAHFLAEAVASVRAQIDRHWELIVVNDGLTVDLERALGASRNAVVQVIPGPGLGPAAARNAGASKASGAWLLFLDDDDRLTPIALTALRKALSEHPGTSWAAGRFRYIDSGGVPLPRVPRGRFQSGNIYRDMIQGCQVGPPATVLVAASAFRSMGGFQAERRFAEDYDLWLSLARTHPIAATDAIVAQYRLHPDQATADWRGQFDGELSVLSKHQHGADHEVGWLFRQAIADLHLRYGDMCLVNDDPVTARAQWQAAARLDPSVRLTRRWVRSWIPARIVALGRRAFARKKLH